MEETKEADPSLIDTADSHGVLGHGSVAQAVTQSQCNDADTTQDWDSEVLNHELVHVHNKDKLGAYATNKFMVFVIGQGIDSMCLLLTMSEDSFKSMGCDVYFETFWSLQALNDKLTIFHWNRIGVINPFVYLS